MSTGTSVDPNAAADKVVENLTKAAEASGKISSASAITGVIINGNNKTDQSNQKVGS